MALRHNAGAQYFFSTAEKMDEKADFKAFDSESSQASLQKILLMKAETCEEKFRVLDARDKLYKLMQIKYPSLKKSLSATCPDMCPEKERLLREYQNRGSIFEMTNFSRNAGFNHSLAVKEYARSSADQEEPLPHELRPINVLTMTMSHLLHNVVDFCELSDDNLEEWYMFMWDRTRALRKELTQQGLCSLESVTLVEQCARFHIHCAERLVDQDSSIYDDKINTENLTKCLQTLKYMYKDLAKEDIKCSNEPEFVCYTLLLNLNNSSVFTELSDRSDTLMSSSPVQFALNVMTAWETRNYIRFFNLVKKTTYLNGCLLRRYFGEMRLYAIKTMIRSYCTKNYSPQIAISRFVENLNFEGAEECLDFLSHCNFNFRDVDGTTTVNFNRLLFQNPQSTLTRGRAYIFIEEKKRNPLSVVLAGGTLPPKLYENFVPENSFNENGEIKYSSLMKMDLMDIACAPPTGTNTPLFSTKTEKPNKTEISPPNIYQNEVSGNFISNSSMEQKKNEESPFLSTPLFLSPKVNTSNESSLVSGFGTEKTTNIFDQNFRNKNENPFNIISRKENPFETNVFSETKFNLPQSASIDAFNTGKQTLPLFSFGKVSSVEKMSKEFENTGEAMKNKFAGMTSGFPFKFEPAEEKLKDEKSKLSRKAEWNKMERLPKLREEEVEEERGEEKKLQINLLNSEKFQAADKAKEENEKVISKSETLLEKSRQEMEMREKEKRETEERLKKQEEARLEMENRKRREESARLEKLKQIQVRQKIEEKKQKEESEYKEKVSHKMEDLKTKWVKWKTKIVFEKWRMKAWSGIEERNMKKYLKEVNIKYPPVCTEKLLNNNPYGLVIPSTLVFEKFKNWRREFEREASDATKLFIVSDELPLIKLNRILGKPLEARARSLSCKLDPFLWKLVISVPDESESPQYWKQIETFVEMHFVADPHWDFGVQKGSLYSGNGTWRSFNYGVNVRRLRGCDLYEGSESNESAAEGCNALIFILNGKGNDVTRERLKAVLKSKPPLPKIPVVLFALIDEPKELENIKNCLCLENWQKSHVTEYRIVSVVKGERHLVNQLIECLKLTATVSASPSSLRISRLCNFFSETLLDSLWRRIGIGLSNFRLELEEPKILIEFYNSCLEELIDIFLDDSNDQKSLMDEQFSGVKLQRPKKTLAYREKIKTALNQMKLPHWPGETPKSSHQLNYRIHQYCKKIVSQDRLKLKNLKWLLYRIIRRSLLWKGLDIYCDEEIREILVHFPWIQVFQEISRVIANQLSEQTKRDQTLVIVYDLERIEKFSFETSLIGKLLKKSRKSSPRKISHSLGRGESEESSPRLENDSIVYAYSAALERESNKRKREECFEDGIDALFSGSLGKRIVLNDEETPKYDFSKIECNLQSLSDRLDELKKQTLDNATVLMEIQQTMQ